MGGNHNVRMSHLLFNIPPVGGAVRLTDWGLIRASGSDARSFLHGQLTQDILGLSGRQAVLAGYCSAKGRLLATFIAWSPGPDEVLLACSADVLAQTLKRLSMFVLRAHCKLSDASHELAIWGLLGDAAPGWAGGDLPASDWQWASGAGGTLIRLPGAPSAGTSVTRHLMVTALMPPTGVAAVDPQTWRAMEAQSGIARVVAATVDQFVPQMLNLEVVGGVSFSKGCYPGQEVVARSQYRGTLKRRAFVVEAEAEMQPGVEIFHSSDPDQPAGMVALSGTVGGQQAVALAELKLSALDGGDLHIGTISGPPVRLGIQPYLLPPQP